MSEKVYESSGSRPFGRFLAPLVLGLAMIGQGCYTMGKDAGKISEPQPGEVVGEGYTEAGSPVNIVRIDTPRGPEHIEVWKDWHVLGQKGDKLKIYDKTQNKVFESDISWWKTKESQKGKPKPKFSDDPINAALQALEGR